MKNLFAILSAAFAIFAFSASAHAQYRNNQSPRYRTPAQYGGSFAHEIQTYGTRGALYAGKACDGCSSETVIDLGGSYLYTWQNNIQFGGNVHLLAGSDDTVVDLLAVGVYNFDSNMVNAIYAKAGIGFYSVPDIGGAYDNQLGLQIGAGKRFPLFSSVTFNPEINLVKRGDLDLAIEIKLINFGINWN